MAKIKASHFREFYNLFINEQITFSRMIEMLNEVAEEKEIENNIPIGTFVKVTPKWTNKDLPKPKSNLMYVRENHNPLLYGLSRTMDTPSEKSYGILRELVSLTMKTK